MRGFGWAISSLNPLRKWNLLSWKILWKSASRVWISFASFERNSDLNRSSRCWTTWTLRTASRGETEPDGEASPGSYSGSEMIFSSDILFDFKLDQDPKPGDFTITLHRSVNTADLNRARLFLKKMLSILSISPSQITKIRQ